MKDTEIEGVEEQLLDVVVTVGFVSKTETGHAYATSRVYRFDMHGTEITKVLKAIAAHCVRSEVMVAK